MHNAFLKTTPQVMAILNVTPDSFSDGGLLFKGSAINNGLLLDTVAQLVTDGADIIDVGGESTRPGASAVAVQEELDRVLPAVEAIKANFDVAVSVDSSTPEVMTGSALLGADMLNDVRAFTREGALAAAANSQLPICIMHMQGTPNTMQISPQYDDVCSEILDFLIARRADAVIEGVAAERVWLDPGFGFGKTLEHNLDLMRHLPKLAEEAPLLIGVSKKRMIGDVTGRDVDERVVGSALFGYHALQNGARILRVHDVKSTRDAIATFIALDQPEYK
ncbi:dihydropteroate synthase [uncultured Umboniibacter sp.]|uniref:dihydropteroate synthase n=1 Tax=uncultured Umboniibacter sp. TaxID=1798917 RepID=UPI00261DF5E6|nr:dihydropteroate synthase [uncultured Umboniibacter sp.]